MLGGGAWHATEAVHTSPPQAGRAGAKGLVSRYAFFGLASQVAGIGFATPALWLQVAPAAPATTSGGGGGAAGAPLGAVSKRRVHLTGARAGYPSLAVNPGFAVKRHSSALVVVSGGGAWLLCQQQQRVAVSASDALSQSIISQRSSR